MFASPNARQSRFTAESISEMATTIRPDTSISIQALNRHIDRLLVPQGINEAVVDELLSHLEQHTNPVTDGFWLATARLAEMALLCAGHYADNGVFDGAGDLLFNPKRLDIYQNGYPNPIVKPRHATISETLGLADAPARVRCRHLLHDTMIHVARGPLIPELVERLRQSRKFPESYLCRLQSRMNKVAGTIAFLSSWNLPAGADVQKTLHAASTETRRFVYAHLCRFDGKLFRRLGDEIDRLQKDPQYRSRFIVMHSEVACRSAQ